MIVIKGNLVLVKRLIMKNQDLKEAFLNILQEIVLKTMLLIDLHHQIKKNLQKKNLMHGKKEKIDQLVVIEIKFIQILRMMSQRLKL